MIFIFLLLASVFEVLWPYTMKLSKGFAVILPTVLTLLFMGLSTLFLSLTVKKLSISIAYPIWSGFGIMGATILGYLLFHEPMGGLKVFFIFLILVGIIGLGLNM
jgi:quaternary ammonium compound-resistance protein SugE